MKSINNTNWLFEISLGRKRFQLNLKEIYQYRDFDINVDVYDPHANPEEVMHEYGVTVDNILPNRQYSAAILAVAHKEFTILNIREIVGRGVVYDVKGIFHQNQIDGRL